jgi:hypothetical protein
LANEARVPNKKFLASDEIDPVILHGVCPGCPRRQKATSKRQTSIRPLFRPATQYPYDRSSRPRLAGLWILKQNLMVSADRKPTSETVPGCSLVRHF